MIRIEVQKALLGAAGTMSLMISMEIKEGTFLAIAGESGSGKTTFLRILAGLEEAAGQISVSGERWLDGKFSLPPQKRRIGFVFQEYALFDNMSVEENLLFVNRDKALAEHLLKMTGLHELRKRYPNALSGGQKQRVSLCRAMMKRPKILLMDEPLSALDPAMRTKLQYEISQLHKEFQTTTIMVSHDPSEIYRLAERVVVFEQGKIVRDGTPSEILLQTSGSQKFSFEGELLEIRKADLLYVAIVSIGQQLVQVVISQSDAEKLQVGTMVRVSTKAFHPTISV